MMSGKRNSEAKVILASSLGTVFQWYDFYLYGLLATIISAQFFSGVNATATLGLFAALLVVIGNGGFGGFLPTIAFAMVAATGDIYAGLWYPIEVAMLTVIVGLLFLPETFRRRIAHVEPDAPPS